MARPLESMANMAQVAEVVIGTLDHPLLLDESKRTYTYVHPIERFSGILDKASREKEGQVADVKRTLTDCGSVVRIPQQDFRRRVGQTSATGLQLLAGPELVGKAEVCELDNSLKQTDKRVKKTLALKKASGITHQLLKEDNIFGFQVSVNDMQAVTILKRSESICK